MHPPASALPDALAGLVDDAAIFPPGNAPLDRAVAAWRDRAGTDRRRLVSSFVVSDHRLAELRDLVAPEEEVPVSVVTGAGAGAVTPACRTVDRAEGLVLAGVEVALRDPDDLAGNARRVVAGVDQARAEGVLDDDTPVYVELPAEPPGAGWLAAADELAAAELRLKLRTGGVEPALFPASGTVAAWLDAALDRELPFKCTAGLHDPLRHTGHDTGFEHQGFLNVLVATRLAFDGASVDEVTAVLEHRSAEDVLALWREQGDEAMARTRRWFTTFGSCSVDEPWDGLVELGLVPTEEAP